MPIQNKPPVRPATREKVYDVIDGERDYQDMTSPEMPHPLPGDHLLAIDEAVRTARRWDGPQAEGQRRTIDAFRKIAGIAVRALEHFGPVPREYHVPASAGIIGEMKAVGPTDALKPL